jgi:hypothetical protein
MIEEKRPGKVGDAYALTLAGRLTDRDRRIALDCYEHRVLTTDQLKRLHFKGVRSTRARLEQLYELRVLERFRPAWQRGQGSTPYHWLLDEAGAHLVAEQLGRDRKELGWRRQAAIALAHSSTLAHQLAVNEFFVGLDEEAHARGGRLAAWWGERRSAHALEGTARPDGYGRIELPDQPPVSLLLELDRATEDYGRLREKARRYAKALPRSPLGQEDPLILLAVPTPARAAGARRALAASPIPLVPVVWTAGRSALAALKRALDEEESR